MPRYAGEPQNLKHHFSLALDDARLTRSDACAAHLGVPRAEAIRRAIDFFHLSLFSSKSTGATIQPTIEGEAQP
jgi:hypothetical protein